MEVRIAVLADYANIAEGGKLNIMGIFSSISSKQVPVVHPQMILVVQYEFEASEVGEEKQVRTALVDDDGREILGIAGQVKIPRAPDLGLSFFNQMLVFNNLTLPRFGRYEFRIYLADEQISCIPLDVVKAEDVPPQIRNN